MLEIVFGTAAFWLRKAVRARASAEMHLEYSDALESIAELSEQMAARVADLKNVSSFEIRRDGAGRQFRSAHCSGSLGQSSYGVGEHDQVQIAERLEER